LDASHMILPERNIPRTARFSGGESAHTVSGPMAHCI
jgi:hypothetical protein